MDKLTIAIDPAEDNSASNGVFFTVNASINGEALSEWLDVDEFFQSLNLLDDLVAALYRSRTKTRRAALAPLTKQIPIFNCSCGCFGCGGYSVDVTPTPEALLWESEFAHASQCAQAARREFSLPWSNIRDVAGELLAAIYNVIPQSLSGEVGSAVMSVNLARDFPSFWIAMKP